MTNRERALFFCSALGLGSISCAHALSDPKPAFAKATRALSEGDDAVLYSMLSPAAKAKLSPEAFRARVLLEREELKAFAARLRAPSTRLTEETTWATPMGARTRVILENGEVHLDPLGLLPAPPNTPEQALRQLDHALRTLEASELLSIFSDETKKALTADMTTILASLADPSAVPIARAGDHATASLQAGHVVRLIEVNGIWKVASID